MAFDPELNPPAQENYQPYGKEQRVAVPSLMDFLLDMKRETMQAMNCVKWGTIAAFDPETQTAQVRISGKQYIENAPTTENQIVDYPVLSDVPVCFIGGGEGRLTFPVAIGDECLIFFNDRDIDLYYSTGQIGIPNSNRLHDISDGFALVGFRSMGNVLSDFQTAGVELAHGDSILLLINALKAELKLSDQSRVSCEDSLVLEKTIGTATSGALIVGYLYRIDDIKAGDSFTNVGASSNANGVKFIATGTTPTTWTNGSTLSILVSMRQAMDALFSSLTGWVDTAGNTPNPATLVLINFAKALFQLLFKL